MGVGYVSEDVAPNLIYMDRRLNYILWIQYIVYAHDYVLENPRRHIRRIDMYIFRSSLSLRLELIPGRTKERDRLLYRYFFLGCKLGPEWELVATGMIYYLLILHQFEIRLELDD